MKNPNRTNRKLLKTGTYTYMVTLPKEWVKELGWRAKQKVALTLDKDKIVLTDWKEEGNG